MTAPVPVLVITVPVGVGKSTIAAEAAWLLRQADVPHALVDLDRIEQSWPVPADDPGNERVSHRNLACMWATSARPALTGDPDWFLDAATHTAEVFERAQVEDHLVDNENRPAAVVAGEVLRRVGWLPSSARGQ
jgi:hypothetical protein